MHILFYEFKNSSVIIMFNQFYLSRYVHILNNEFSSKVLETKAIENPNYFHFYHFSQCSYRSLLNQAESHVIFLGFIANFRILF